MALLICFSGRIGSGKSSVSEAIATRLGWNRTGFGDYLRAELLRRDGKPDSREELQNLGQSLVEADAEVFCRTVLKEGNFFAGDNFVIDGVRHVAIQTILAKLAAPSIAKLIFLAADDPSRLERVIKRPNGETDFTRAQGHVVESELDELSAIADLKVDASQGYPDVVEACMAAIYDWIERTR